MMEVEKFPDSKKSEIYAKKIPDWNSRGVSTIHASIVFFGTLYAIIQDGLLQHPFMESHRMYYQII